MRRHVRFSVQIIISFILLTLLVGVNVPGSHPALAQDGDNLLQNPGFEGEFIAIGGDTTLQVATGWQNWHLPPPAGAPGSVNLPPDYQPAPPNRINSGSNAQQYDTFFATHIAGLFQRVSVNAGDAVRFTAFIYPYSSASFENIDESVDPQGLRVSVGIDPSGGTDGDSPSIIWSEPVEYYDEYRELSVTTTATGAEVTVFVRSAVDNATGLHQVFVDDASLTVTGDGPGPIETETATTPPPETETASPTTETPTPETPTDTPTSPPVTEPVTEEPPTPSRTPYSEEFPNELVYVVQPGDTVGGLALRYGSTIEAVIQYNGLSDTGLIYLNQTILIPVPSGVGEPVLRPSPTSTPGTPGEMTYVVQPGDNLFRIALRFNITVETLAQYNNILNPTQIYAGQELRIPTGGETTPPMTGPPTAVPVGGNPPIVSGGVIIHTVQPGENLFRIGLRYNVTVDVIARANGLFNPNLIFVGQQLIIPR